MDSWVEVVRKRNKGKGKGKSTAQSSNDPIMMIAQAQLVPTQGWPHWSRERLPSHPEEPHSTYGQLPSNTHHRGMGVFGLRTLQLDDQVDVPSVWRQQTPGTRTEGGQTRAAPGTPSNSLYKQTLLAPSAQGGDAKGKAGPPATVPQRTRSGTQAAARAETLEKALASTTEGGDPTVKKHLTDELAKPNKRPRTRAPSGPG